MARVLAGIDVLKRDNFAPLRGKRIGLITNPTGQTKQGKSTADVLLHAPNCTLTALFSPEHGLRAQLDEEGIPDGHDSVTGLPIYSLYGQRRAPSAPQLAQIDALVFDIQDVGTRFYTYISTLALSLDAAAEHGKSFVVLDRPNPLNGTCCEGPVTDTASASFVAPAALPIRHGLTVGEWARLHVDRNKLHIDLHVVPCDGWKRGAWFDETHLTWTNPSPNMRSLAAATLYPGIGLLEQTNVSVGRGTDTPFEQCGAPFVDKNALAEYINAQAVPGVQCLPVSFVPASSVYANQTCGGVEFSLTDRNAFDAVRLGLTLACGLRLLYPDSWETPKLQTLLAHDATYQLLLAGASYAQMEASWREDLQAFREQRVPFLLYT